LLLGVVVALVAQSASHARTNHDQLPYSRGYLVTGNFMTFSEDFTLTKYPATNGLSTGTIQVAGVPENADAGASDIVAAYLYWETVHPFNPESTDPTVLNASNPALGVKFDNQPIAFSTIRAATRPLVGNGAVCWGAAGNKSGYAVTMLRANVLDLLPKRLDAEGNWTGKYKVNGAHTVTLREGSGDQAIQSGGAGLFVVYRKEDEPLRKIIVYDGVYTAYDGTNTNPEGTPLVQTLAGFYAKAPGSVRFTQLVGTGGNNTTETVTLTGATIPAGDPFPQDSPASDRSWTAKTYNLSSIQPTTGTPYGETLTATISANANPAACRAWAAMFLSVPVPDTDLDGLNDFVENFDGSLLDPNDAPLPNLKAMGAGSDKADLFVELNAMWAEAGETYGSPAAPYYGNTDCTTNTAKPCSVTDADGHHHMPTPADLKLIGDRFQTKNIRVHFDVGDPTAYKSLLTVQHADWVDVYNSNVADGYLVGSGTQAIGNPTHVGATNVASLARGGEFIKEVGCDPEHPLCLFPDFAGTAGWEYGMRLYRDAPVGDNGEEISLDPDDDNYFDWDEPTVLTDHDQNPLTPPVPTNTHRTRFDGTRRQFYRYGLGAHARGGRRSYFPCLINGVPSDYPQGTTCSDTDPNTTVVNNPAFVVPTTAGGIANLPGRNFLFTFGFWDDFVAKPFPRSATIFHEIGHMLGLWHGGPEATWGNSTAEPPTTTFVEPNCGTNRLTSMSYSNQIHGLFDELGNIHMDFSHSTHENASPSFHELDETLLVDRTLDTTPHYRPTWYTRFFVPNSTTTVTPLVADLGVPAATRFCTGEPFGPGEPSAAMARVHSKTYNSTTNSWAIDWDGDFAVDTTAITLDVNFDGFISGSAEPLNGYADWDNIHLNQIGAGGLTGGGDYAAYWGVSGPGTATFMGGPDELVFLNGASDLNFFGGSGSLAIFGGSELATFGGSGTLVTFGGSDLGFFGGSESLAFFGGSALAQFGGSELATFGGSDLAFYGGGETLATFGGSDISIFGGSAQFEMTNETAKGLGRGAPYGHIACQIGVTPNCTTVPLTHPQSPPVPTFDKQFQTVKLTWQPVTVGQPIYHVFRRKGGPNATSGFTEVGTTTTNMFLDASSTSNATEYTWRVRAEFNDEGPKQFSGYSNPASLVVVKSGKK
jgi:hypothetical protein